MAAGRVQQVRIHAVRQAQLVGELFAATKGLDLQQFIDSGVLGSVSLTVPENALADKIQAYIAANDGKLIVDQQAFDRMAQEVQHGQP